MGKFRRRYYALKSFATTCLLLFGAWTAFVYISSHDDSSYMELGRSVYLPLIRQVTPDQLATAIKTPNVTTLVFIYSSEDWLSRWYFDDINDWADHYQKRNLRILAISVDQNPYQLAAFLASKGQLHMIPFIAAGQYPALMSVIAQDQGHQGEGGFPFIGVINKAHLLTEFPFSLVRLIKVRSAIDDSLESRW